MFNWRLSKALGDYLLSRYQVHVVYTHEGDHTALDQTGNTARELAARAHVANSRKADLLVSIHHNAGGPGARGGEMFVWTDKRTSDGNLRWLPAYDGRPDQNHTDPKSYPLARKIYPHLREALQRFGVSWRSLGDPGGIGCADFGILRNTVGPAVLIETHFGTDRDDAAAARHPDFISALARAIGDGIADALSLTVKTVDIPVHINGGADVTGGKTLLGVLRGGTVYVTIAGVEMPLRAVAETFGCSVKWVPWEKGGPLVQVTSGVVI